MFPTKGQIFAGFFAASLLIFVGCSTAPKEKIPVQVGQTSYKDRLIPVFDGSTVKCDRSTPPRYPMDLRRSGVEGEGVVMVIVNEEGHAVEFGMVSSTPEPQFGVAAAAAAKRWRYYPVRDGAGVPLLYALRLPVYFRLVED